jgi:hypothetical protein
MTKDNRKDFVIATFQKKVYKCVGCPYCSLAGQWLECDHPDRPKGAYKNILTPEIARVRIVDDCPLRGKNEG